jgi:hypothetical protein
MYDRKKKQLRAYREIVRVENISRHELHKKTFTKYFAFQRGSIKVEMKNLIQ